MSAKALSMVWQHTRRSGNQLVVLLILADNTGDDGVLSLPPTRNIADHANIPEEEVGQILVELQADRDLIRHGEYWLLTYALTVEGTEAVQLPPNQTPVKPGYVYVLKGPQGYYKIGKTVSPDNRIATFGIELPFDVEYELVVKVEDYHSAERRLHERYANKRVRGEWFALTKEDLQEMRGIYGS